MLQRQRLQTSSTPYRRFAEWACWLVALACVLYGGAAWQGAQAASRAAAAAPAASPGTATAFVEGAVLGQLRIPSLGLTVPVLQGDDSASLLHGVGHIEGTALPGGLGTVGLAGHRDTFLRPLERIRPAMQIQISRGSALYRYTVDSTEIVKPEAVRVLDMRDTPELVLVTCYPFHYIGAAPMRFIVHAHLVSLAPDVAGQ